MSEPFKRAPRRSALALYLLAMAGLFLAGWLSLPIDRALGAQNPQLSALLGNLLYYLPFLALPLALTARRQPRLRAALRPNPLSPATALLIVALALLGVFVVNDITILWSIPLQKLGFDVNASSFVPPVNAPELAVCVLAAAALPGVCEELLFRGALMSTLERDGARRAVLGSSLLFMLMHGSLVGAPAEFLLGAVMAQLVLCTDSIYAGMIYHTVHNASVVILQFVQARAGAADAGAADLFSAIGGLSGVVMLLLEIALLGAILRLALRALRVRARLRGIDVDAPGERRPWSRAEGALLIAALVLAAALYALDAVRMLGV